MDIREIEKAYAMGRAYAMGLKHAKLMAKLNTITQDTMKDGFATLVDSEGQPYVANLNPKEKERYSETGKKLSQVKKEEKTKKEQEQKEAEEKARKEAEAEAEAKTKKEKEKEDLFEKYWAESASAGLYQKRKEAEAKKKETKKAEVKTEEHEPDENSFKGRLKRLLNTPFKRKSGMGDFQKEWFDSTIKKLDPNNEKHAEALKDLEKAYNDGDVGSVHSLLSNVQNYLNNPQSYERSLKANERSLNKSLDTFEKVEDKVYKLAQEEKKKLVDVLYKRGQQLGSKLTKNQIAEKVDTSQKEGRLTYLMQGVGFKSEGLRLASRIAEMKKSIKSKIEQIKKHNPARYTLFSINLEKPYIKDLKDNIERYLSSYNIAMDSAEFKEIQSMLDDLLTDFDL